MSGLDPGWVFRRALPCFTLFFVASGLSSTADARVPLRKQVETLTTDVEFVRGAVETILNDIESLKEGQAEADVEIQSQLKRIRDQLTALSNMTGRQGETLEAHTKQIQTIVAHLDEIEERLARKQKERGRLADAVLLTSELRVRSELVENMADLSDAADDAEGRHIQRLRLGLELQAAPWADLHVVLQDARLLGSELSTLSDDEGLGVHRAFITLRPPVLTDLGLSIELGRLGLSYGSGLLVGEDDWSMTGRSFDGLRLRSRMGESFWLDLFWTLVRERRTPLGADVELSGIAGGTDAFGDWARPQAYVLYLKDGAKGPSERAFATVGLRVDGEPLSGLTYELETAFQIGQVGSDRGTVDRLATLYHLRLAYALDVALQPVFHFAIYATSGDGNPEDDRDVDFDPLFGDRYSHLDPMGVLRMSNLFLTGVWAGVAPIDALRIEAGFYLASLTSTRGRVPGFGGQHFPVDQLPGSVGQELHIGATYSRDVFELKAGYAAFLPGGAAKESTGGSDAASWFYGQARLRF